MKKFLSILICLLCLFNCAHSESFATPTDINTIKNLLQREVYISSAYENKTVIFTAVLVNFKPDDHFNFIWQYTTDQLEWITIPNENQQTYSFVLNATTSNYWYRVIVIIE